MKTEDDVDWLRKLSASIWERHEATARLGAYYTERRQLTKRELKRLEAIFERHRNEWVFEPGGGVFGFGVSMSVYAGPQYPGLPPEQVFSLTMHHVWEESNVHTRQREYAWVQKYTHTDRNRELRAQFGMKEPLREMSYYDY